MEAQRRRERLPSEAYDESDERTPMYHERVQADVRRVREQKEREERERQEAFERAQEEAAAAEKARIEREKRTRKEREERARRNTSTGTSHFPFGEGRFAVESHYQTLELLPTASIEAIKGNSTPKSTQSQP